MRPIGAVFSKIKKINDEIFLKHEKITIIDRNRLLIQNYGEILEINDDLIKLSKMTITGKNLKFEMISKYFIEISGNVKKLDLGDKHE
jgi:sporulation protein YqfC